MSSILCAAGRVLPTRLAACSVALVVVAASPPLAAAARDFKVGPIAVERPWSRATPPGATAAVGYLEFRNDGNADDRLVSASSPAAPDVRVHEMKVENGVMTMRPLGGGLPIPAGEAVALKPGGRHLMLVGLKQPLKAGDEVPLTLTFEKAGTVDVALEIERPGSPGPGGRGADATGDDAMEGMTR